MRRDIALSEGARARRVQVAAQIVKQRLAIGVSPATLASRIGVPIAILEAIETGTVPCTAEQLWEISKALEKEVSYFFSDPQP